MGKKPSKILQNMGTQPLSGTIFICNIHLLKRVFRLFWHNFYSYGSSGSSRVKWCTHFWRKKGFIDEEMTVSGPKQGKKTGKEKNVRTYSMDDFRKNLHPLKKNSNFAARTTSKRRRRKKKTKI